MAVARYTYPFYLLLDLAEDLLENAKKQGADTARQTGRTTPESYIDFHVVAGSNSHHLMHVRKDDYQTGSSAVRTLRPLSLHQLERLRLGVADLRAVRFPRSKLHTLLEAALLASDTQAERHIRDVFARCRFDVTRPERQALWRAVLRLLPTSCTFNFPWFEHQGQRFTCLADLVEAMDLFPLDASAHATRPDV